MNKTYFAGILGFLMLFIGLVSVPVASAVSWTDWSSVYTTGNSGSAGGTMTIDSTVVNVSLSGMVYDVIQGNYYYASYPSTYNNMNPFDLIQEAGTGRVTITFSTPVVDPYISMVSIGQGYSVNYTFQNLQGAINVVSSGVNFWGYIGYDIVDNTFYGYEYNGILQLTGTYSSLTFSIAPNENWHGFNIGAASVATGVPEPATLMLLGLGLLGLAGARRKVRK